MFKFMKAETLLIVVLSVALITMSGMYVSQVNTLSHDEGMLKSQQHVITEAAYQTKALEEHIKYMEYRLKAVEKELEVTFAQMDSRHGQLSVWLHQLSKRMQDAEAPMLDKAIKEAEARIAQNKLAMALVGGVHIGKRIHELESAPK